MLWAHNEVCGFSSKISVQSFFLAFSITTIGHCFVSRLNYSNRLRPAFSKFFSPPQIQIHFHPPQSNPAHLRTCSQVLSAQNSSLAPSRHKGNVTFWPGPMRPSTSLTTPSQNVPQTPQLIPTRSPSSPPPSLPPLSPVHISHILPVLLKHEFICSEVFLDSRHASFVLSA